MYDSVNKRLFGLGENTNGSFGVADPTGGVLAFDLVTGERIVLLEPTGP